MRRLREWHFGLRLNTRVVSAFHRRSLEITVVHLQFFPCLPTTGMFPLGEPSSSGLSPRVLKKVSPSAEGTEHMPQAKLTLALHLAKNDFQFRVCWAGSVTVNPEVCITRKGFSTAWDFSMGRWDLKVLQLFCHWEEPRASEGPQWTLKAETRAGESGIPIYIV